MGKDVYPAEMICENCGHEWIPRTLKPMRCPNCTIPHRFGGAAGRGFGYEVPRFPVPCPIDGSEMNWDEEEVEAWCPECHSLFTMVDIYGEEVDDEGNVVYDPEDDVPVRKWAESRLVPLRKEEERHIVKSRRRTSSDG